MLGVRVEQVDRYNRDHSAEWFGMFGTLNEEPEIQAAARFQRAIDKSDNKWAAEKAVDDLLQALSSRDDDGELVWADMALIDLFVISSRWPREAREHLYNEMGTTMFSAITDCDEFFLSPYDLSVQDCVLRSALNVHAEVDSDLKKVGSNATRILMHAVSHSHAWFALALSRFDACATEDQRGLVIDRIAETHPGTVVCGDLVHRLLVLGGPRGGLPHGNKLNALRDFNEAERRALVLWNLVKDKGQVLFSMGIDLPEGVWLICVAYLMCDNSRKLYNIH